MGGKIDMATAPVREGTGYPPPYDAPCQGRKRTQLAAVAGITEFGVNLLRLPAGQWSSQRHWHSDEDEVVWVVEGEVVLVTDAGETVLRAGDCAAFKAGDPDGHHIQNRSGKDALLLEIGSDKPDDDVCIYPDIDLKAGPQGYTHADGTPLSTTGGG